MAAQKWRVENEKSRFPLSLLHPSLSLCLVGFGRAVSRFLSAPCGGENHLSQRPIPGIRPLSRRWSGPLRGFPIWSCTRRGFPCRVACASRGALLPHLFTITARTRAREAVCFLWHCPSEPLTEFRPRVSQSYRLELRGVAPYGVRTFLPRLAPGAILRPSKTKASIGYF